MSKFDATHAYAARAIAAFALAAKTAPERKALAEYAQARSKRKARWGRIAKAITEGDTARLTYYAAEGEAKREAAKALEPKAAKAKAKPAAKPKAAPKAKPAAKPAAKSGNPLADAVAGMDPAKAAALVAFIEAFG